MLLKRRKLKIKQRCIFENQIGFLARQRVQCKDFTVVCCFEKNSYVIVQHCVYERAT